MYQLPMRPESHQSSPACQVPATANSTDSITACPCESVWTCMRGRTRLCCELQADGGQFHINLLRNSRTYGRYQFTARDSALTFASRLRVTFEGNGWSGC